MQLLRRTAPPRKPTRPREPENPWSSTGPDVQTLSLAGDAEAAEIAAMDFNDPFTKAMLDFEPSGRFTLPAATREMLLHMEATDVYVVQWGTVARPSRTEQALLAPNLRTPLDAGSIADLKNVVVCARSAAHRILSQYDA